jgi:hypothetical protein
MVADSIIEIICVIRVQSAKSAFKTGDEIAPSCRGQSCGAGSPGSSALLQIIRTCPRNSVPGIPEFGKVAISVEVAYLIAKALKTSLTNLVKEIEKN